MKTVAVLAVLGLSLGLSGCFGQEKAAKSCSDYAYQDVCARKDACVWADGSCKPK